MAVINCQERNSIHLTTGVCNVVPQSVVVSMTVSSDHAFCDVCTAAVGDSRVQCLISLLLNTNYRESGRVGELSLVTRHSPTRTHMHAHDISDSCDLTNCQMRGRPFLRTLAWSGFTAHCFLKNHMWPPSTDSIICSNSKYPMYQIRLDTPVMSHELSLIFLVSRLCTV